MSTPPMTPDEVFVWYVSQQQNIAACENTFMFSKACVG